MVICLQEALLAAQHVLLRNHLNGFAGRIAVLDHHQLSWSSEIWGA